VGKVPVPLFGSSMLTSLDFLYGFSLSSLIFVHGRIEHRLMSKQNPHLTWCSSVRPFVPISHTAVFDTL
jgi:hypothetical protein